MTKTTNAATGVPAWSVKDWILLGANAAVFLVMFLVFDGKLPDQVASHYDINGDMDGTMPKWGFWLLYGALSIGLPLLITLSRYIDPRKKNYARFQGYFDLIRWTISAFLQVMFLFIALDSSGHRMPIPNLIIGAIGLLFVVVGNRMSQVRSNFFVGIKTPWALMDEDNWRRTHRIGARLWVVSGLLMVAAALIASSVWLAVVTIAAVVISSVIPTAYSYLLFRRKSAS
ncbi:SdpI family protein [Cohnella suwonensis]|uniref:SdpI family protein n=1 Tax=Cohnella suwonensis TaxID=696072 RepID=A0ABW0LV63_9BACL